VINTPTVLILGAGASAHLKYPLGGNLLNEVVSLCHNDWFKELCKPDYGPDFVDEFRIRLSRSGFYSVDAFLEENTDLLNIGKFAMAICLKGKELDHLMFPPNNPGWYQTLFNAMHCTDPFDFRSNRLTIVTFNYDRSLEHYLYNLIQNRYRLKSELAAGTLAQIPIIHVHGILGDYPAVTYSKDASNQEYRCIASQVKVIHEIADAPDGFCTVEFAQAHQALQESERVFFLGFGFHEPNIRRFRFFTPELLESRQLYATSYMLFNEDKQKLATRLSHYGIEEGIFRGEGWGCDDLLKRFSLEVE
jgi:hypothetical protein